MGYGEGVYTKTCGIWYMWMCLMGRGMTCVGLFCVCVCVCVFEGRCEEEVGVAWRRGLEAAREYRWRWEGREPRGWWREEVDA